MKEIHRVHCGKAALLSALLPLLPLSAQADIEALFGEFNAVERSAALATLRLFREFKDPNGRFACDESARTEGGSGAMSGVPGEGAAFIDASFSPSVLPECTGKTFKLFRNMRRIIHTANQITGEGQSTFSMRGELQDLRRALRWTAGEEYSAQGDLSSDFVNGQLSGLSSRLNALRLGASGFNLAGFPAAQNRNHKLAAGYTGQGFGDNLRGGGASADAPGGYSRWGGFINLNYGWGSKDPTEQENAFDFDGSQVTLGMDYRYNDHWVLGAVGGIISQDMDFDSNKSVVGGGIEAEGFSFMPFAMYQTDTFFVSASVGYQQLEFDTERKIQYASLNPAVESVDTMTVSNTDSDALSLFIEVGYIWQKDNIVIEPFVNLEHSDTTVDEFAETDLNDQGFDLFVEEQKIDSLEYTLGVKFQYTFTPSYGVFIPYLSIEHVSQSENDARSLRGQYASVGALQAGFDLSTDALDKAYNVFTVGMSSVIRGARQQQAGGVSTGGVQAFINYKTIESLQGIDQQLVSLGFRYEF